jgi:hypothetical protein
MARINAPTRGTRYSTVSPDTYNAIAWQLRTHSRVTAVNADVKNTSSNRQGCRQTAV